MTNLLDFPAIAVMPTKAWRGINDLSVRGRSLIVEPWQDAWTTPWATDAHMVTYQAFDSGSDFLPRCNKPSLRHLRAKGADLKTRMLVLDFDNPGHRKWSQESLDEWIGALDRAADEEPLAWLWSLLYTTTHGARLVYVLNEWVPVDIAEGYHRWLCQRLREVGIKIDDIGADGTDSSGSPARVLFPTSDWTRCFRLPFVMRDGCPTWEAEICEFLEQEIEVDLASLGQLEGKTKTQTGVIAERNDPKPDLAEAMTLLQGISPTSGRLVQSVFKKKAKARLKGRLCSPCLFADEPLAPEGSRDSTIMQFVGEATTLLYPLTHDGERITTPQHVFGLFLDPVLQLEPDDDTADWTNVLWRHVLYCWSREEAEAQSRVETVERRQAGAANKLQSIVDGMREWCIDPRLLGGDEDAKEFAFNHLLAATDRGTYVMTDVGWYDTLACPNHLLTPRIKSLGMDDLIQVKVSVGEHGQTRDVSPPSLINEHGTPVSCISGLPGAPHRRGAWVDKLGEHDATINVPLYYRRDDLVPTYDRFVDRWLQHLFGDHYEQACNWIGWALAVEEGPICSLSVKGAPGAGKKMLVQGLGECFNREHVAGASELTESFQPGLMSTPILNVDEGWPARAGGKHPADMFRELVGGGRRFVNRKYKDPVETRNPVRVIFTANNFDVVKVLCGGRDMSPEDRSALAVRIYHIDVGDGATRYLNSLGGEHHTRGWIAGDGGERSRYVIAKHFLWLHANQRQPRDKRLLVEGNGHESLMLEMRTQAGSSPFVIEALIRMLETKSRKFDGLAVLNHKVYVLTSEVLQYFRDHLSSTSSERLTAKRITQVFKGLCKGSPKPVVLETRSKMGRKRWHELDLELLQKVAQEDGWRCEKLDFLVEMQQTNGEGY